MLVFRSIKTHGGHSCCDRLPSRRWRLIVGNRSTFGSAPPGIANARRQLEEGLRMARTSNVTKIAKWVPDPAPSTRMTGGAIELEGRQQQLRLTQSDQTAITRVTTSPVSRIVKVLASVWWTTLLSSVRKTLSPFPLRETIPSDAVMTDLHSDTSTKSPCELLHLICSNSSIPLDKLSLPFAALIMRTLFTLPDGDLNVTASGSRTSVYLLLEPLQANGGLPDRARLFFANSGREGPRTINFMQKIEAGS